MPHPINPTIDLLLQRKSIRAYESRPISAETKQQLFQATLRAPTAGNMMLYTIIDVQDQKLKDRLAITCDDQPFIATAPLLLLFLADYQRWDDYYNASDVDELCVTKGLARRHPQEGDLFLACCDAIIAAQTAVVAAEALGLGSCYIGDIMDNYEIHRDLFNLPRYVFPISLVCFGYPTEPQINRPQSERFSPEYIVYPNKYRRLEKPDFDIMFRSQQNQVFAGRAQKGDSVNLGQFNYLRKFSAKFSIEMNRSVRAILRNWEA